MRPILERYAAPLYGTVILPRLGDAASAEEGLGDPLAPAVDAIARARRRDKPRGRRRVGPGVARRRAADRRPGAPGASRGDRRDDGPAPGPVSPRDRATLGPGAVARGLCAAAGGHDQIGRAHV